MDLPGFIGAIASSVFNTLKSIASKTYEDAKDNLKQELRTKLKDLLSDDTYVDDPFPDNECDKVVDEIATFLEKTKIENLELRKNFMEYLKTNEQKLVDILNGNKASVSVHQKTEGDNSPISGNIIGNNSGNTTYNNNGSVYHGNVHNGDIYNGVDSEKK